MQILLDTCSWLWWLSDIDKLSKKQLDAIVNRNNQLFLSVATIWELSIKVHSKKLTIPKSLNKLIEKECPADNISLLDIKPIHAIEAGRLPLHHKDPFDRMIIAQSILENLTILTSDSIFQEYDISRLM